MSNMDKICVCGKIRGNLNFTNWQRHLDNCKSRKTKSTSRPISSFFSAPKKVRLEENSSLNGKVIFKIILSLNNIKYE